ncbi:unnamed protein product, partial [Ilex paraguariensis]
MKIDVSSITLPLSIMLRSSTSGRAGELQGYRWQRGKLFSPELTEFMTSSRSIEKVQQVRKNMFHGGFLQLVLLLLRVVLCLKKLNKGLTGELKTFLKWCLDVRLICRKRETRME